jgi:MFS family permease
VGTFILPAGRLGDLYGHKRIFLLGTTWYGIWSLVCGFSVYRQGIQGSILFSVARGFQGIGPSLMVPNALAIAGRNFKGKKKDLVFALFGACAPAGAVLGGFFSALFGQLSFWPWTFWMAGVVCFVYTGTSAFILPADDHNPGLEQTKPSFDYLGTITGVSGLVLFNFAWNQAAVVGWQVPYTYVLLIVGLIFFFAFLYIEVHVAEYPLVPIKSLEKEAIYALSIIACGWASFGIWVYYAFQLIQHIRGHSLLSTVAQQSPTVISGFCASLAVGVFLAKTKVANIMFAAMCCFLTGQILLATAPVNQTYWAQTFVTMIIMPVCVLLFSRAL